MAERLTVCFYCDRWPTFSPMHGPARYVQTLARGLVARDVTVHVVTAHPESETDFIEDGYAVHARVLRPFRVVSRFQPGIGESYGLWRAIHQLNTRHRFDVVEFTNVEGVGFRTALASRIPTVIRIHTTAFDAVRLGTGRTALERGYARLEHWTAHRATALVTHTKTHRAQVAVDYGVPEEQIRIVPHGIAPTIPDRAVTRRPLQVLTVGAVSARKGVLTYLEAVAQLVALVPGIHFVWAGVDTATSPDGTLWRDYAAAQFPQLAQYLEFRSGLSDGAIASLYLESGCYLCTSRYESFGLTLVEAMMAGLPVIAPRTSAMSELIRDGETGRLFDPESAADIAASVQAVLQDEPTRRRVSEAAMREAAAEYTADVMTSRMLELYRGLC